MLTSEGVSLSVLTSREAGVLTSCRGSVLRIYVPAAEDQRGQEYEGEGY